MNIGRFVWKKSGRKICAAVMIALTLAPTGFVFAQSTSTVYNSSTTYNNTGNYLNNGTYSNSGTYNPSNQSYLPNSSFGGQIFNVGASALIGCASGILAGEAGKGISSLLGLIKGKKKKTDENKPGTASTAVQVTATDSSDNLGSTAKSTAQTNNISTCLDAAAWSVAQNLLQQISQKTLNWVNTGLNGNPLYVQDVGSYLTSIRNQQLQNFFAANQSNDSLFGGVINSVVQQKVTGYSDGYLKKLSGGSYTYHYNNLYCQQDYATMQSTEQNQCASTYCDNYANQSNPACANGDAGLSSYCAISANQSNVACQQNSGSTGVSGCKANVENKYKNLAAQNCISSDLKSYTNFQGDFTQGGWDSFFNTIEHSDQNPVGALFTASQKLSSQIGTQQQQAQNEIQRNNGFLDMKVCVQYGIKAVDPNIADCSDPANENNPQCANINCNTAANANAPQCQGASVDKNNCLKYQTTTPGSIIASQVSRITGTPVDNAENINKINQTLQSFFQTLLSSLLQKGLASLGGNGTIYQNSSMGPANVVYDASGNVINSSPFTNTLNASGYDTSQFDISRPQNIRAVIQAQADYLSHIQDTKMALDRLVPLTGELDYCLPGPNPSWADNIDDNLNAIMLSFTVDGAKNNTKVLSEIGSTAGAIVGSIIPGVGTVLGSAVGFLLGTLVGWVAVSHKQTFAFDAPTLADKTSGNEVTIASSSYKTYSNGPGTGQGNDPVGFFAAAFNVLRNKFIIQYSPKILEQKLSDAFAATVSSDDEKALARGNIAQSYAAVSNLDAYSQNEPALEDQYQTDITTNQSTIAQLNAIKARVDKIVLIAKQRYIKQQADNGTPVNTACIDAAYQVPEIYGTVTKTTTTGAIVLSIAPTTVAYTVPQNTTDSPAPIIYPSGTLYTVDMTNASAAVRVGDTIIADGSVTGKNMTAYTIFVQQSRKESDTPDPVIQQSDQAAQYFYNSLLNTN